MRVPFILGLAVAALIISSCGKHPEAQAAKPAFVATEEDPGGGGGGGGSKEPTEPKEKATPEPKSPVDGSTESQRENRGKTGCRETGGC